MKQTEEKIEINKETVNNNDNSIFKKIKDTTKNTTFQVLHIIWAEKMISPVNKNEYLDNLLWKKLENLNPDQEALIWKAWDIRAEIIFWENNIEDIEDIKLFKKYLLNECINRIIKYKKWNLMLSLYADHEFPSIIENAAKKAGISWELNRIKYAWWMWNYWSEWLKKGCIIYFEQNEILHRPWYQIRQVTYKANNWIINKESK